jgi:murein DD-endopeptidase MepM/ murein hydrolase activator NlpD
MAEPGFYSSWMGIARVALTAAVLVLLPTACEVDRIFPADTSQTSQAVPNPGYHIVQAGDSLISIATRYGLTAQDIADANSMQAPYVIHKGQFLILPRARVHEVRQGENLYRISLQYALDVDVLAEANGIGPPYTIYPGQQLVLPESPQLAAAAPPAIATPTVAPSAPVVTAPLPGAAPAPTRPPSVASSGGSTLPPPPPSLVVPKSAQSQLPAAALPPPLPRGGFLWPVRGEILSSFGPNPGGLHNDGINIAAPRGTPIVAAQSGVVIFVGEEIEGFGKLLIIRHGDGWSTAYGHNDVILVGRGDKVARGAVIARVGSTGDVPTPQLHFEIRRQTKAVDPLAHLASLWPPAGANRVASRDARPGPG